MFGCVFPFIIQLAAFNVNESMNISVEFSFYLFLLQPSHRSFETIKIIATVISIDQFIIISDRSISFPKKWEYWNDGFVFNLSILHSFVSLLQFLENPRWTKTQFYLKLQNTFDKLFSLFEYVQCNNAWNSCLRNALL